MALADDQYRYTNSDGRSIVVGADTDYEVVAVDGLEGFAARVGDRDLPRGHGSVPGRHYAAARQILVDLEWGPAGGESSDALWRVLAGVMLPETDRQAELAWKAPGRAEQLVRCRPVAVPRRVSGESQFLVEARVALLAADPRVYSVEEKSAAVPLYTPAGGSTNYALNYPVNWPASLALEQVVENEGNADAFPTIRFYGPVSGSCTGVRLQNTTTGEDVEIAATIASGQILTFDGTAFVTGNGDLVVGLGGASRYGDWVQPRAPLALPPGQSVLRFTSTGTSTDVACVVTWRDTSIT